MSDDGDDHGDDDYDDDVYIAKRCVVWDTPTVE